MRLLNVIVIVVEIVVEAYEELHRVV